MIYIKSVKRGCFEYLNIDEYGKATWEEHQDLATSFQHLCVAKFVAQSLLKDEPDNSIRFEVYEVNTKAVYMK